MDRWTHFFDHSTYRPTWQQHQTFDPWFGWIILPENVQIQLFSRPENLMLHSLNFSSFSHVRYKQTKLDLAFCQH